MKKTFLVILVFGGFLGFRSWNEREFSQPPGVLVPDPPHQQKVDYEKTFWVDDYEITALAEFSMQGRVLGKEIYRFDRGADVAPVDLALGWGEMSDSAILDKIEITQSNRWYRWRVKRFPIPARSIQNQSANMHLIPATPELESLLKSVRRGEVVHLQGHLVKVQAGDGWRWKSSLTRTDSGNGACELIYVAEATIVN